MTCGKWMIWRQCEVCVQPWCNPLCLTGLKAPTNELTNSLIQEWLAKNEVKRNGKTKTRKADFWQWENTQSYLHVISLSQPWKSYQGIKAIFWPTLGFKREPLITVLCFLQRSPQFLRPRYPTERRLSTETDLRKQKVSVTTPSKQAKKQTNVCIITL